MVRIGIIKMKVHMFKKNFFLILNINDKVLKVRIYYECEYAVTRDYTVPV